MNCGDGQRCYNGGICHLQEIIDVHEDNSETATTKSFCDCPPEYGGPSCQTVKSVDSVPAARDDAEAEAIAGSEGEGKGSLVFAILIFTLFFTCCSWVTFNKCRKDEVDYSVVAVATVDDESGDKSTPRWRNIV